MNMKKVLILTHEDDPHSKSVCRYFDKVGVCYYEVLTDKLIEDYKLTFDLSRGIYTIDGSQGSVDITRTSDWSIWNRRVMDPVVPEDIPAGLEDIVFTETARTWEGLLFTHPGRVVNKPQSNFNANNKLYQLLFVRDYGHGISVPRTILTNNPNMLRAFYRSTPRISFKLQRAPIVQT